MLATSASTFVGQSEAKALPLLNSAHPLLFQALEAAKKEGPTCKTVFDGLPKDIEKYQPENICNILKRITTDRTCTQASESKVCKSLIEGFLLDPQAFVKARRNSLQKNQIEIVHLEKELKHDLESLAEFKKKLGIRDSTPPDRVKSPELNKRLDVIEELQDALEEHHEEFDKYKDELTLFNSPNLSEREIVTAYCRDESEDKSDFQLRVDVCIFSYFFVRPAFPKEAAHAAMVEACLAESSPTLGQGGQNLIRMTHQIYQSSSPTPSRSPELEHLMDFLYETKNAKKLGIPVLDPSLRNFIADNWKNVLDALEKEKSEPLDPKAGWKDLNVYEVLEKQSLLHNPELLKEMGEFFPRKIRILPNGEILGIYTRVFGDGKDRHVVAGFDLNGALQGKVNNQKLILAVATLKAEAGQEFGTKIESFRRLYEEQSQMSKRDTHIIKPPRFYSRLNADAGRHEEAFTVEDVFDGDLDDLVKNAETLPTETLRMLLEELVAIEKLGVIHRDIKPSNILYKREGEKVVPLISDYGLMIKEKDWSNEKSYQAGTPAFLPPEGPGTLLSNQATSHAIAKKWDTWSMGLTFYAINYAKKSEDLKIPQSYGCDQYAHPNTPGYIFTALFKVKTYSDLCSICGIFCGAEGVSRTPLGSDAHPTEEYVVWRMLNPDPEKRASTQQALELMGRVPAATN
jgi:serine/threonine protein kinase